MATATGGLIERMKNAALLDVDTYEAVEHDEGATRQAAMVVGLVAIAQGIASSGEGLAAVLAGVVAALLGWLLWAGITYLIGDKLLGGTATWGELLRTLGFAQSPGVLYVFGIIPLFGGLLRAAVAIWILIAGIIAIRQALDFGTGRAVATAVLGWLAIAIPVAVMAAVAGG
ncbi:MAG: YIP1 family protein [Gemmatimonadota bacterium]